MVLTGFVCAAAGPAAHLLGLAAPIAVLDRRPVQVAGIVVWCVAAVLARASQIALGRSWRRGVARKRGERPAQVWYRACPLRPVQSPGDDVECADSSDDRDRPARARTPRWRSVSPMTTPAR